MMASRIEILDSNGAVIRVIRSDPDFAERVYPGSWRLAEIQDAEAPTPTPAEVILKTIVSMEREQLMPRLTRETILSLAEERAAALGLTQAQLIAKNKGYAALKAFDMEIAALRAQL